VDDAFALMVSMPIHHRVACLRDDIVFLVFLYQRYLYPVDKTRANEFGIAYEHAERSGGQQQMQGNHQGVATVLEAQDIAGACQ